MGLRCFCKFLALEGELMMKVFRGLFPPLITTFDESGRFDEQRMRSHVDFVIEGGADGLCPGSSTGELSTLTREEWEP